MKPSILYVSIVAWAVANLAGCGDDATPTAETETETDSTSTTAATTSGPETGSETSATTTGSDETGGDTGATTTFGETSATTGGEAICGDGEIAGDEECDDGNDVDGDGCNAGCVSGGKLVWQASFDAGTMTSDILLAVDIDSDGNIVVAGTTGPDASSLSMWVSKHASDGEKLWDWTWPGPVAGDTRLAGITTNALDEIIVTGQVENPAGRTELWTGKLSPDGVLEWADSNAGAPNTDAQGQDVVLRGEEIMVVGALAPGGQMDTDLYLRRYADDGTPIFQDSHDPDGEDDEAMAVAVDADGNYAIGGRTSPTGAIVLLYDAASDLQWVKTFAPIAGVVTGIGFRPDGSLAVGGMMSDGLTFSAFVRAYGSDGSIQWDKIETSEDVTVQYGLATDTLGNVVSAAGINPADMSPSYARVRKRGPDGEPLWIFEGDDDRIPFAVTVGDDGRVVVVGTQAPDAMGSTDFWVAELTP